MRIVYVSGGAADIINAHRHWMQGVEDPSQVSRTFSGQVASYVIEAGADALLISFNQRRETLVDGRMTLVHLGHRERSGLGYYVEGVRNALRVLARARRFRADVVLVDSGALPFFTLSLFRAAGIRPVPILHNTLWPAGNPPRSGKDRVMQRLDETFWRSFDGPALTVSPEGERQIATARRHGRGRVHQFRPMFCRPYFDAIAPVPSLDWPFTMLFVGRAVREKGLFLLLDAAIHLERVRRIPVRWIVCGDGDDLAAFRAAVTDAGMEHTVDVRGWTTPAQLQAIYADVHALIVPTTSGFAEGFAMTAVEAVLAGRPFVSNRVVPALELLAPAAVEADVDDAISHADAVATFATDRAVYDEKRRACAGLAETYFDERHGLKAALHRALGPLGRKSFDKAAE
jgi:glycosyltransferase involved in cell wall biosynthesis